MTACRRRAVPDRHRDGVLPPGPPAAASGGPGHQQQNRAGAADPDRATPGGSRPAPVRSTALLNVTLTPEALTKQYLEVLHDMRQSNNLVILVPTEGGVPMLNLGHLRANLRRQ